MKTIYISSYCVFFRDYPALYDMVRGTDDLGVELATSWTYPEFDALLDAQVQTFAHTPVTIHAPFVEICNKAGSPDALAMDRAFEKAFRWYDAFHATSMVMHTHEKAVSPGSIPQMIQLSRENVLRAAAEARRRGVRLTVENVGFPAKNSALFTQDAFVSFIESLPPEVGALIDTGHAMANHWDIPDLIRTLGSRIGGYHLHNTDGVHDLHRPLFEDGLWYDEDAVLRMLETAAKYSPAADLVLEYAPGAHITTELLRRDARRVQEIWHKACDPSDHHLASAPGKETT